MKDIIIIGRGLAGATLSFHLIELGIKHRIVDRASLSLSSKIAAGLINPIVLKRLKMVQGAERFIKAVPDFYKRMEAATQTKFYHETFIKHIFANPGEINLWEEKKDIPFHSKYLKGNSKNPWTNVNAPHGIGTIQGLGWLDTKSYLSAHALFCERNNVSIDNLTIQKSEVLSLAESGHQVILCNGHLFKDWNLIPAGIFTPTRGEVITVKADDLPTDSILHSSIFTLPLGSGHFRVGATYHWDNLNDQVTAEGLNRLKTDLEKVYTDTYEVIQHEAGVRPNIKDRKPIMGQIGSNLYIFNGMGSRAALMTPFLSTVLIDFLTKNIPIPPEYDVHRFDQ